MALPRSALCQTAASSSNRSTTVLGGDGWFLNILALRSFHNEHQTSCTSALHGFLADEEMMPLDCSIQSSREVVVEDGARPG